MNKEKLFDTAREQIFNTPFFHEKFQLLDDIFKDDEKIVLRAIESIPSIPASCQRCYAYNFQYSSERLRDKLEIAEFAVQRNGEMLKHCSERLRNHKPLVLLAVKQWGRAFEFASDTLKSDYDVISTAIENDRKHQDADYCNCCDYCNCECDDCDRLDVLSLVPEHVLFETAFIMRFADKHLDYLKIPVGIKQLLKSLTSLAKQLANEKHNGR